MSRSAWIELLATLDALDWGQPFGALAATVVAAIGREPRAAACGGISALIGDTRTLDDYLPHTEVPRPFMDKYVLYMHPGDSYRVRLHIFRPGQPRGLGAAAPKVHDHRWSYVTAVLAGEYCETRFRERETAEPGKVELEAVGQERVQEGQVRWLEAGVFHQTVNDSDSAECVTLFIRGPAERSENRVWDPGTRTIRSLKSRREQVVSDLSAVRGRLSEGE